MPDDYGSDEDTVMELFGFKVKVSNPRLAEVLRMDAKEALTTDVRQFRSPEQMRQHQADLAQAVPDAVVADLTSRSARQTTHRSDLRTRTDALSGALGFDVDADGAWRSPIGVTVRTRIIDGAVSPATAVDAVSKLAPLYSQARTDESVLFIVEGEGSATSYLLALRQQRAHSWARVIRMSDLESLRTLCTSGAVDHERTLAILCSAMATDAGLTVSGLADACTKSNAD